MRRVLTFLTAIVLLSGSLAVGVFTADLPFWRRAFDLPLKSGETYLPTVRVGAPQPDAVDAVDTVALTLDPARLDRAADVARAAGANALLVAHHGKAQLLRYFAGRADRSQLLPADFLARALAALAVGVAHGNGLIGSLDDSVAKYLPEWDGDARGAITVRQLLTETSGLETSGAAAKILGSRPFTDWSRLPHFATSRGIRLLLGNDFESTALGFRLEHEPGGFFNVSPVNAQLAAIIVERASGMPYESFLDRYLLRPARVSTMEMQMDRLSGMPAAHCCLQARSLDVLRLVELLRTDGESPAQAGPSRVWPAGWVAEMRRGSRANPDFGLQLEHQAIGTLDVYRIGGSGGGVAWSVPAAELSVVMLAPRDTAPAPQVLDAVLQALRK